MEQMSTPGAWKCVNALRVGDGLARATSWPSQMLTTERTTMTRMAAPARTEPGDPRGDFGAKGGDRTGFIRWHRPEVLSPSRVHYTTPSRITKAPCTSHGTPREARSMSLPAAKTASSVSGTPAWAPRSSPIRPTATRCSPSRCKSPLPVSRFRSHYGAARVYCIHAKIYLSLAHMTTPGSSPLAETDLSSFGM